MRPRIVVSTDTNTDKFANYVRAIEGAGGEVVPIRDGDDAAEAASKAMNSDGWLLVGGRDLTPVDEPLHPNAELITESRQAIEDSIYDSFIKTEKPILGICMGAQYLNLRAGGPLHQHIPDIGVRGHGAITANDEDTHVTIEPGSLLAKELGVTSLSAKCHHHQAIRAVGQGYAAVAWEANDKRVIEAIEDTSGKWRIGVQWHPERTGGAESDALFAAFVRACAIRRAAHAQQV
jgi:putative glutamine amidotransferase